ncbi:glycosyltransferase family 4 protein [Ilyomonas limi]|uniref:Glycosyltransferase family 4 protein n=1 Tax=Ilyomonas limi TaxID=2575867 RepID=A0A4U3KZJ2_9BACT|nr:glycosyltransferase family 4 protein [Ilyomonas limi]TKK68211.1 glycosyltransferase family 4 protein [Ilyomonas limi]
MNVTQISIGRFHHFHLARQLERHQLLDSIWTGYRKYNLRDETGIDQKKIKTYPWLHTPYMAGARFGITQWHWLKHQWAWLSNQTLDSHVSKHINTPTILMALSGCGLHAGIKAKKIGGYYICDRGSAHIRFQDEILKEEHEKWGLQYQPIDPRVINKEETEYEASDIITVPSEFARKSFIEMGVSANKICKVIYGARLERFKKVAEPSKDIFRVLWVGAVSIQKGFMYALRAFQKVRHPKKEFVVIGHVTSEVKGLLHSDNLTNVIFKGTVANHELPKIYSSAHVFILSSVQEGLAMVQGEALACGCPVIATNHTGGEDLFTDGVEGFIVPIRSVEAIAEKLQLLANDRLLRIKMSEAAIKKVQSLGGWDSYGKSFIKVIQSL